MNKQDSLVLALCARMLYLYDQVLKMHDPSVENRQVLIEIPQ